MTKRNPHQNATDVAEWKSGLTSLQTATVVTAPSHTKGDDKGHTVKIRIDGEDAIAEVPPTLNGDTNLPTVGDDVYFLPRRDGMPVVVSARYSIDDTIPPYESGERVIGHPPSNSEIRLKNDGSIVVENDSGMKIELTATDVVINGGTKGAIYDVTTTKDVDGHVTDITLKRRSNILI